MKRWEVISHAMTDCYSTDWAVEPKVLAQFRTKRAAERYEYRIAHSRAVFAMHSTRGEESWRQTQTMVRRIGVGWSFDEIRGLR